MIPEYAARRQLKRPPYNFYAALHFFQRSTVLELSVKRYKKLLDRELRHIKLILAQERRRLDIKDWLQLVHETKQCIIESPEEFICKELPSTATFLAAIEKVFDGFLEDQRLLAAQGSVASTCPAQFRKWARQLTSR